MLQQLASIQSEFKKNTAEFDKIKDLDPEVFEAKKKEAQLAKDAANRWTDNIYSLQSYCSQKFGLASSDFNKQFEIPEDFDYVQ